MNKISKKHLLVWSRRALVYSVIFFGLLMVAARLVLPEIASYREDIEALAADILESPVTIERIESGWAGLRPVITLIGVQMQQADGQNVLRLDSLDVVLGVIPSLFAGELRPKTIVVHMQQLELQRLENGQLNINLGGLADSDESSIGKDQLDWILQQPDLHVDIDTFVFNDRTGGIPEVDLHDIGIDFVSEPKKLTARLKTKGSQLADEINLTVSLDPDYLISGKYEADLYLQLKAASLSFWKQVLSHTFYLPDEGNTDVTVWMSIEKGSVRQIGGELSLDNLVYKQTQQNEAFSIESMATNFSWQSKQSGWELQLKQLHFQRSGERWPPSELSIEYRQDDRKHFLINADYFIVQDFLPLIDRQPLVHDLIGDDLRLLSPAGEINNLRLQFSINSQDQLADYALQTQIINFSVNANGEWPGVEGLDGDITATEQAGLLQISTIDALLDLRPTFRDPLRLDSLQGDINWAWLTTGLLIESKRLDASNSHITTQTRLSIHIPTDGSAYVDLQTDFENGDGAYTSFYLPASVLSEETLAWLDKSIVSGHVDYGSFILHGVVDEFPYDDNNGRFEVRFKVRDGILDYYKDWPRIDEMEAEVAFVGRSMRIEATSGKIFGAELSDTVVGIKDLESDNPILTINGQAKTSSSDLFHYLEATKLSGDFQTALSALTLRGMNDLDLEISIPMSAGKPTVKGQLAFLDNQLNIDSWGLQIDKINGLLDFTDQSFVATDIQAVFEQQKVIVNVDTLPAADGPEIRLSMRSRADLAKLIEPKNKVLASQFDGESPFEVIVSIPDTRPSQLTISSSLLGTALNFPHPLGKQADEELEFLLKTGFTGEAGQAIEVTLGERLQASFVVDADTHELASAYVQLGNESKTRQSFNHDGLILGGRLDYLDIDDWKRWIKGLDIEKQDTNLTFRFATELKIDRVKYARWIIDNFSIKASPVEKVWRAEITGEGAEGHVSYDNSGTVPLLDVDFKHLAILKQQEDKGQLPTEGHASTLRPADFPEANIKIHKLVYDGRELGQLTARTKLTEGHYQLEEFNLETPETQLTATGGWMHGMGDDQEIDNQSTHLNVDIDSGDFGRFMERLGYVDTVKDGEASLQLDFSADTSPLDFDLSQVSGEVHLSILKGEVVEIDPGSAGRIFGLLSFQTLPRRLSLDFTDIFSKGMSFDEISGTFSISQGQAYTNNLMMDAPSSQVEVSGRIGLKDEDYDQHVRVIPNLSSTLPLAGALAGGPGLAVVMLITHKLLQKPIDKLTAIEYKITGAWQSPDIVSISTRKEAVAGDDTLQSIDDDQIDGSL